jgi:hypothetical protein
MDDYVTKPVKLEIVVNVLEKWALKIQAKREEVHPNIKPE